MATYISTFLLSSSTFATPMITTIIPEEDVYQRCDLPPIAGDSEQKVVFEGDMTTTYLKRSS